MSLNDQQILQTTAQIGGLLLKKAKGELSEEDQAVLEEWLSRQSPADRQFFDSITGINEMEKALQYMYNIDEEAALTDVLRTIQPVVIPLVPVRKLRLGKATIIKYAAAAIVTGAIITTSVMLFNRQKKNNDISHLTMEQRYRNDVLPGNDKAILQLADGRNVILDSIQNGKIADQGRTGVNKQNGIVVYNAPQKNDQASQGAREAPVLFNTLRTPRGGQYQVQLPDGSKVWLNAQSSLRFPAAFTGQDRQVEITGEAYFEVAKNAQKPFRVNMLTAGGQPAGQVEVLGTHFNINAYDDEGAIKTTLLEGKVKVSSLQPATGTRQPAILEPGEQAEFIAGSRLTIHDKAQVEPESVLAWKNGLFRFQDASIESIMRQVARWYDVQIVYEGKIDKQFIGTIPRHVPVSTVLKILESTGWVHFMIDGKKITVAP